VRAEVEGGHAPESHLRWAEAAEDALYCIEEALKTPAASGMTVMRAEEARDG
jgi:hypothetical protein